MIHYRAVDKEPTHLFQRSRLYEEQHHPCDPGRLSANHHQKQKSQKWEVAVAAVVVVAVCFHSKRVVVAVVVVAGSHLRLLCAALTRWPGPASTRSATAGTHLS